MSGLRATSCVLLALLGAGCAHAKLDPVSEARRTLARELVGRGDPRAALPVVDALLRAHPRDARALVLRGVAYRDLGLAESSERDLRAALAADPRLAEAHSALAVLYDRQRRPGEAAPHHERAVELDRSNAGYLNNLGFSLFARGRPRDAIAVYERALRLAPIDARVWNNLGFAYAVAGDFPRAAQSFAMGGSPAQASNNLGWSYEQKGMLAQAFDRYVEAVRLDPALASARSNLAAAAEALGRPVPADLRRPPPAAMPEGGER